MKSALEVIVLGSTKVADSSIVLHTLSREYGRRSFITSIRKGGSMALFQNMSILEGEVTSNPKSDLWRIGSLSPAAALTGIRSNPDKNVLTLFMSEVLYRCIHEGEDDERLYLWCREQILLLDALKEGYASFHLRFLLELCALLGFMPTADDLRPFAGEALREVIALLPLSRTDFLLYPLNGKKRSEIASALIDYLGNHLEIRLEIRSLAVLKELYSTAQS